MKRVRPLSANGIKGIRLGDVKYGADHSAFRLADGTFST